MKLTDPQLLKQQAYINGKWVDAENKSTFAVINPADGQEITQVADLGANETRQAIEAAEQAFYSWRVKTAGERAEILQRWYQLQLDHLEDLAIILTTEQGKPLKEATGEIRYGASFVEWYAEEGKRTYGDVIPTHAKDRRLMAIKQPIGVVAAITPWNFPHAMLARKVSPALAAGCTVVIKPAEDTPLSALALAELADRAGFPPGAINVVPALDPVGVGGELTSNCLVRKLSFTGSTEVGKLLMRQCADTVKKLSLELGGNAPFIVFDDADLEEAVNGAIICKYRNAGQTCVGANRIYVQEGIYDAFAEKYTHEVKKLKIGSGMNEDTVVGPLINQQGLEKVEALVNDAISKGATVLAGGQRHELGHTFYENTVLADVTNMMKLSDNEIFGPVAPLYKFKTEEEVIKMANDTTYGLASYFYTRDLGRSWRVAEALEFGVVGVNTGLTTAAAAPFGGVKESGIGREGSKYGIDEFLEIKYMCIGGIDK
ncbi:MAG: NAD-dependent succinate-semialdehyde dehydrogenase [Bacteroidetes bacterium]|nr:NAD-dependent succinate-semialdehyde dehydrogenase [Bacteroidota bacterium]